MLTSFQSIKNNNYTTSPFMKRSKNLIFKIESKLNDILLWNNSLDTPIIMATKDDTIKKIVRCFFYAATRPVAIGFAGETASGKTTIANELIKALKDFEKEEEIENFITKINMDNYYYDRSEEVKKAGSFDKFVETYDLDSPTAFELDLFAKHLNELKSGKEVMLPEYDMSGTAKRWNNKILAQPAQMILTEGLFTFTEVANNCFDIKFYVDIDEEVQKARWYRRAKDRNLGASADRVYNNALSKAKVYIRPTKNNADIILNGEVTIETYKIFINKIIDIIKEIRTSAVENETKELAIR